MEILDVEPTTWLVVGVGAATLGSEDARRAIGRGIGWVAGTAWRITRPVVTPVVNAGRDMAGEVRDSAAARNGGRATGGRPRRTAASTS